MNIFNENEKNYFLHLTITNCIVSNILNKVYYLKKHKRNIEKKTNIGILKVLYSSCTISVAGCSAVW